MNIYKLTIDEHIEYEFKNTTICFYHTKEEMETARDRYRLEHIRDGKWIPNISSIDFYEEEVSFEDLKDEMTVKQLEELFNTVVSVNDSGELVVNKVEMTKDRAIEILSEELHHTNEHLRFADKAPEYYEEMNDLSNALTIAIDCIKETL